MVAAARWNERPLCMIYFNSFSAFQQLNSINIWRLDWKEYHENADTIQSQISHPNQVPIS